MSFPASRIRSVSPTLAFVCFLALIAPSIVGYRPYHMAWDDLYFFHRALCVHHAVYDLDIAGVGACYSIVSKSPVLTLLMLPWGAAAGGEAGIALAMIGLAILIWIVALLVFRVALAAGAEPWAVAAAGLGIWLNPFVTGYGGAFLSDIVLAWITLLLLLLIPLELRTAPLGSRLSTDVDAARGLLWGFVISIGLLAKMTFLFFLAPAAVAVLWIRWQRLGWRASLKAAGVAVICALPALFICARLARGLLFHALQSSFGGVSKFYAVEGMGMFGYLREYVVNTGAASMPTLALAGWFFWKYRGADARWMRILPVLAVVAYLILCSLSSNRDFRFALPVMIVLPFVFAVVPSGKSTEIPAGAALLACGLLAGVLCSIPMLSRPDLTYVRYAGAVLDGIASPGTKIMLATDGGLLNIETFLLAKELRGKRMKATEIDTLVYDSIRGLPIEASYRRMESAGYILFHKPPLASDPPWANQFAGVFQQHARRIADPIDAPPEFMEVFRVRER